MGSKRVIVVLFAGFALAGCAGFKTEYESVICYDHGIPTRCEVAFVELRCAQTLPRGQLAESGARIAVTVFEGLDAPVVGEIADIKLQLEGAPPWQTLKTDVGDILRKHRYAVVGSSGVTGRVLDLVGVRADVRVDQAEGSKRLQGTLRGVVGFTATLLVEDTEIWSAHYVGEGELTSYYPSVADAQQVFSDAYCGALEEFAAAVGLGMLDEGTGH